jgi:hypothetical protein
MSRYRRIVSVVAGTVVPLATTLPAFAHPGHEHDAATPWWHALAFDPVLLGSAVAVTMGAWVVVRRRIGR